MEPNINEATRLIDLELSGLERRCLELKARRHTYIPIGKLPNEVLIEIFAILKANHAIHEWHCVAHVCRHWRYVALEAADLWTMPPMISHDYTLVMLERSRNRPLHIAINRDTTVTTRNAVLENLRRIESLFLNQDAEGLKYFQDQLADAPLQLRTLTIYGSSPLSSNVHSLPPFRLTFRQAASLQHLKLSYMDVDWRILPICGLQSLAFAYTRIYSPPSWPRFQKDLGGMLSLEILHISLTDLQLNIPGPSLPEPLHMPHLRELGITTGTASATTYFLSNTTFPQLRRLYVTTSDSNDDDNEVTIHTAASKVDFDLLDSLFLGEISFVLSQINPPFDGRKLDFSHSVIETDATPMPPLARRVMAVLAAHPISRIVSLGLEINLTSNQMLEIFGYSLPHLESIQVFAFSKAIIDSLIIPRTQSTGRPIPFACLRTIRLEEMDCAKAASPELLEALCDCLTTRMEHDSAVTKVHMKFDLTLKQASELRELVDLELDGQLLLDEETG